MTTTHYALEQQLLKLPVIMALLTCIIACGVLIGWQFNIALLKSVIPNLISMKANTAIAFLLSGVSLALLSRGKPSLTRLAQGCALLAVVLPLLTLGEYLFGWDLGIDQMLFKDTVSKHLPGRMAIFTIINFVLLTLALLLINVKTASRHRPSNWLALMVLANTFIALIGYWYGVNSFYRVVAYSTMALHTALLFMLMATGIFCLNPDSGLLRLITAHDAGGLLVRRLLPAIIILPPVIGWAFLYEERLGYYTSEYSLAMFAVSNVFMFLAAVWRAARSVQDSESKRQKMEEISTWQQAILNSADYTIISTNLTGMILTCNAGALTQLGYSAEEVIGKANLMLLHVPEELARYAEHCNPPLGSLFDAIVSKAHSGSTDEQEWTYVCKDGRHIDVRVSTTLLYNEQHQQTGYLIMAKNISERIKHKRQIFEQQQQLQASHLHNQSILDNANCSIITTDVNGKITTFSKGAQKMLGYSEDEMLGQIGPDVVVPILHLPSEVAARSKALSAELQMVIEPGLETFVAKTRLGLVDENEWTYIHNDGHHITVLLTVTAQRDAQDNIIGFMGIAIDISERKRVERLKSEFVSTVSHELRTPLTSIRGALGLVLGKASMDLSDKARMLLETANRNSERLTLLINDLLDLEKIESGTLVFSLSPVDIVAIARQAVVSHESYASQHQVSLVLHDAPTYVPVMGDEHRLLQVFSNLLSNAIKYSPAQGLVEVSIRQQDHYVRIGIKDSGGGIPEAFRTQIFQRFAQADSSDTRAKGGTGLGLSISKAIIERHDGTIGYHSQEGVGTEFYLEIPLWQEVILHDHTLDQRPHLLVCEDNTDVAHILSQLLAQEGLASDIAHSATAAKHLLAAHNYRALLLDLTLPDMDGLTLITELHNNSQLHDLPIIVVSGRIEANQSSPAVEYNHVIDWLQKPVVRERLTSALHKALAHGHKARILHIEDDHDIIQITQTLLEGIADYSYACTITDAKAMLAQRLFDIILLDLMLPDGSGLELLDMIKQQRGQVIIFSGHEPTVDTREQVNAVLIKSKTSNQQLLNTVKQIINREHDHLG